MTATDDGVPSAQCNFWPIFTNIAYVQGAKKVLDPQKSDCKQKMEHLIKIHW